MINLKQLPIKFQEDSGANFMIEKGNYIELLGAIKDKWVIKTLIDDKVKLGKIPQKGKNGNPVLVYLAEFDEKIEKEKGDCYEIRLEPRKAVTLRTRPLTEDELKQIIQNRLSEESKEINRETVIFGVESGVEFELLDGDFGTWQKIKIQTRHKKIIGFINKVVKGISTRKNNCK